MSLTTPQERAHILLAMARRHAHKGEGSQPQSPTWTRPVADLRDLLPTPFAITGGVATRLYMPERLTEDLDLIISPSTALACEQALHAAHARLLGPHPAGGTRWWLPARFPTDMPNTDLRWNALEFIAFSGSAPACERQLLDLITVAAPWLPEAFSTAALGPTGLPVLALPYLALMKLTSARLSDVADLCRMLRAAEQPVTQAVV